MTNLADEMAAVQPPIVVDPGVKAAQAGAALRQMLLISGGFATLFAALVKLATARDFAQIVAFIQGDNLIPFLTAAITVGTVIWGQLRVRWTKLKLDVASRFAPNWIARWRSQTPATRPVAK